MTNENETTIQEETRFSRGASCYRPLKCRFGDIEAIHIYDEEGVYYKTSSGWLEHYNSDSEYSKDTITLFLKGMVRKRIKETFTDKTNYLLKRHDDNRGFYSKYLTLYIYLPRSNKSEDVEVFDFETETETHYNSFADFKGIKFLISSEEQPKDTIKLRTGWRTEKKPIVNNIDAFKEAIRLKGFTYRDEYEVNKLIDFLVINGMVTA